jgi:hypothetical protein
VRAADVQKEAAAVAEEEVVEEEEVEISRLPEGWEVLVDDETGVDYVIDP